MADQNTYCRLCLCKLEESDSVHVLTSGPCHSSDREQTLLDSINTVFPFKIDEYDGYSMVICSFCDRRLADTVEFFETSATNQDELKRRLGAPEADAFDVCVKEEDFLTEFLEDDDDYVFEEEEEVKRRAPRKHRPRDPDLVRGESFLAECDFCGERFRSKVKVEEHMFLHIADAKPEIQCFECDDKFFTSKQMRRHNAQQHPRQGTVKVSSVISRYLYCQLCKEPEKFDRFQELAEHMQDAHETKGYASCCDKKFYTRRAITNHVDMHVNPTDYLCAVCNKLLPNRRSYREHIARHQPDSEKKFQCDRCDKRFFLSYDLRRHIASMHERDPNDVSRCEECNKTFTTKGSLHMHNRRFHMDVVMPICETCGKICRSKSDLKSHIKARHTETEKFKCDICGNEVKDLKRHLKYHFEASLNIRCEICNHQTTTYKYLRLHMKTHSDERPFQCSQCGQSFKRKKGLDDHMSIHTGIPKHFCNYCDRSFNNSGNKFKHIKQAHPVEAALHAKRPGKLQAMPVQTIEAPPMVTETEVTTKMEPITIHGSKLAIIGMPGGKMQTVTVTEMGKLEAMSVTVGEVHTT